ncbi:hypothetical protein Pcinc_022044 [Petrolisthes cinctipes]|uniref:Dynein axonemal intermediate chain 4 n=1 Tax=Petrolisthes cinctipes TaxID=88211 RepID=A0AAE1FGB2_PETCI|nr:hypothetical protein Pcinc_022044 [Petrolisthes cinctipes]
MGVTLRVKLQETPTLLLYQQENTSVSTLDPDAQTYLTEWQTYTQKRDHDHLRTREVTCQTEMKYVVDKTSQKSAVQYQDTESWATQWDMHDHYERLKTQGRPSRTVDPIFRRRSHTTIQYYYGDAERGEPRVWTGEGRGEGEGKGEGKMSVKGVELGGLMRGLGWVERQLSSTTNLSLLHSYTSGRKHVKERRKVSMSTTKSNIEKLWQFKSHRTKGRRVNAITFCKTSPWLVIASYGPLGLTGQTEGMLVGWNVKKISQPELWLELSGAGTVVSCCPSAPQMCCVTLLDGTLRVYQLDTPTPTLLIDTSVSVDKHSLPIWGVEWRESQVISSGATKKTLSSSDDGPPSFRRLVADLKGVTSSGSEIAYVLVSCSEDGTVKEWIFVKGSILFCTTLFDVRLPLWLSVKIAGGIDDLLGGRRRRLSNSSNSSDKGEGGGGGQGKKESGTRRRGMKEESGGGREEKETDGGGGVGGKEKKEDIGSRIDGQKDKRRGVEKEVYIEVTKDEKKWDSVHKIRPKEERRGEKEVSAGITKDEKRDSGSKRGQRNGTEDRRGQEENIKGERRDRGQRVEEGGGGGGRGGGGGGGGGGGRGGGGVVKGLLLPQNVPVTSIHFRPGDKTTYLLGTSSGEVLLCRTFERGHVGGVFDGHGGQVTKVAWRTAGDDANSIFLSASMDDTIRVWHVDKPNPICVLRLVEVVSGGYVDACWCPWYGNLVAGVHGEGLHLWDISLSTHTPALTYSVPAATCVAFSPHTRVCQVTSHHCTSHHITPHHHMSHHTTVLHNTTHHSTSHHTTIHHTTPQYVPPHHTTPPYVTPHHSTSQYITVLHITSRDTINVVVGDAAGQLTVFHLEGLEISASVFLRYSTKISKLAKLGVIPVESSTLVAGLSKS